MSTPVTEPALKDTLRDRLVTLCAIASPSLHEDAVAAYLRTLFTQWGLSVREDDAGAALGGSSGNLIVEIPGGRPERVMLNAHIDTVPPVPDVPLSPVVDGDVVRSSGAQILGADDKAGVAIVLSIVEALLAAPMAARPTLIVVFTVAEEGGLRGAHALNLAELTADFGFAFDGEVPVGEIIAAAVFKESISITVHGRRAHAALEPEKGIHAISAAAAVVSSFPMGHQPDGAVGNLASVHGGGASNVIPDEVKLEGEVRAFTEERLEALTHEIRTNAEQAAGRFGATVMIERRRLYDGYDVPEEAVPFEWLRRAAPRHGLDVRKVHSIGGSDTNVFNMKGVPTVNVGVGMHEIHSVDEWIDLRDLERVTRWLIDVLTT